MIEWLKGKKTYIIVIVTFTLAGLAAVGVDVPLWIIAMLTATGLYTARVGTVKK